MKYRHIVFDIDGTMTDTETALMRSLQDTVYAQLGVQMPLTELHFAFGIPAYDAYEKLGITDREAASAYWRKRFVHYGADISIFEGITQVLQELKSRGHILGIITSKSYAEFVESFTPFGLNELFALVISADDTQTHKPEPGPMLLYLKQMNAQPNDVLYVGDTSYDMACAHGAGVDSALAVWGNHQPELVDADYYPHSPLDLIPIAQGDTTAESFRTLRT